MIFVFQDASKIPEGWLGKVAALQVKLEELQTPEERKTFIDSHSGVWGEIKEQLLEMSGHKCWYSEAPDAVSDWHVDHFRPKKRALDEDRTVHEGYHWLAFDWMNYRIAGSYPNSPHRSDEGQTRGKWDFFPLARGSVRASWENRDCSQEICLLLDPTNPRDPKLMTFDERGHPIPTTPYLGVVRQRVETTVRLLNLDHARLVRARKQIWRETVDWIEEFRQSCPESFDECTACDHKRLGRMIEKVGELTGPGSRYAATARACLRVNGLSELIQAPEEAAAL